MEEKRKHRNREIMSENRDGMSTSDKIGTRKTDKIRNIRKTNKKVVIERELF
jgi:hypothetical protein